MQYVGARIDVYYDSSSFAVEATTLGARSLAVLDNAGHRYPLALGKPVQLSIKQGPFYVVALPTYSS